MSVAVVTSENFHSQVLDSEKPTVVDFWAPWCGPCRAVAPVIQELAEQRDDVQFVKVNVDDNPALSAQYGIQSIPTLVIIKDGEEATRLIGAHPKRNIEAQLANI
jgi:thioredoxin 1